MNLNKNKNLLPGKGGESTHFKLVIKAYLMYTDENQDELLGLRQYLLFYRELKSETWDLTYSCGMCGYRVQIQLELRAEYLRK